MLKKIISLVMSIVMVLSMGMASFATENASAIVSKEIKLSNGVILKENSNNSFIVDTKGIIEVITVSENKDNVTVSISNENTGIKNYLVRDKTTNTLYSSITGETIKLHNSSEDNQNSKSSTTEYCNYKLSYAEMRSVLGDNSSVAGLASLILTLIPGGQAIGVLTGTISTIVGGVATIAIPNDSNSGYDISYKLKKYYRGPHGHQHVYKKVYTILDIEKY